MKSAPEADRNARMKASLKVIDAQRSWVVKSDTVELAVTELGAHMAPVIFAGGRVQPYYISPWQNEKLTGLAPVLAPLRGDFFCLPFGGNAEAFRGEKHPPHGETCGGKWSLEGAAREGGITTLAIGLKTRVRKGTVRREFTLIDGHDAVYTRAIVEGFTGPAPFAHHAILRMPKREGALHLSTSKFAFGRTYPVPLANPAEGQYQWLARDAEFQSLGRVPSIFKDEKPGDCTNFPTRAGFCDLLQQFEKPRGNALSWVAAVNTEENWLWFALKDPRLMPGRLFWIENRGRHGKPWFGRNSCLGIEDGCMYFDRGVAESSRANPVSKRGVPTCVTFRADRTFEARYIQGAVKTPKGFDRVARVEFAKDAAIFHSTSGRKTVATVRMEFLRPNA